MTYVKDIKKIINESIYTKQKVINSDDILKEINTIIQKFIICFKNGGKVLFCGNGGSAADAQHLAAEFTGRFSFDRKPLFAEALHVNSSYITAVANDYSYDIIYSRLIEAIGKENDILFSLSTSGNSKNILNAINTAKKKKMINIGLTGKDGGKMKDLCENIIIVPSNNTARIQESHIMIGHIICELTEKKLFS